MIEKAKVKVIKKGEAQQKGVKVNENRKARVAARQIVNNVSGWVQDLQTKKREAAKLAFDNLFNSGPRPSES